MNQSKYISNTLLQQERLRRHWSQRDLAAKLDTSFVNISRWERGITTPGPYFRRKLCTLFGKSAQELGLVDASPIAPVAVPFSPATSATDDVLTEHPALWTVPYARNPHFTGRDNLLDRLDRQLLPVEQATTRRMVLTQPQAIKGLGGIGKTQIAVEYAYRARERGNYKHILWVNAASEEAILTSFLGLVEQVPQVSAGKETRLDKLVAAILRWLEQNQERWLLIFDNADDLALLPAYLPRKGPGSLLLTTRAFAVASIAASLEVPIMDLQEGMQFLLQRTQQLHASDEERNEAMNVVIALDGFPLALDQAGAYIEETGCSFGEYLHLYETHRKELLIRRGRQTTAYPDSVATTWALSFQQVEQTNPAAADLLRLCAFLAPDHIPEELFQSGAACWPPSLQEAVADLLTFNQMLESLLAFSLVRRLRKDRLLSLHRLVQMVQRDRLDSEAQRNWAERVVRAIEGIFPRESHNISTWNQCVRYLEQAQAAGLLIQEYGLNIVEPADLLYRAGRYLNEHACYTIAEQLYQQTIRICEQQSEDASFLPLTASTFGALAILYKNLGRYAEAEPLYLHALQILEQHLGPHHPQTAGVLNNLANFYKRLGKYAEAEPLYQQALQIAEQSLGPNHPQVAKSLDNLANLYRKVGRHPEAELLYQRALLIEEHRLEPLNPQIAGSLHNLAELYTEQSRYAEAEPLYQRALQITEQSLGPCHPNLAYPLVGLAGLSTSQGKYEVAEAYYLRGLSIREQHFEPHHPEIAESLHGLALLRQQQGHLSEALALAEREVEILTRSLGDDHPRTSTARTFYEHLRQR